MSQHRPWGPVIVPPKLDGRTLEDLLQLMLRWNVDYLREAPQTPPLYEANIRYVREEPGTERWLTIPWLRLQGHSVCHSLCAWRVAELRMQGEAARFAWHEEPPLPDGSRLFHVRVKRAVWSPRYPNGLEDPSLMLGMGGTAAWIKKFGPMHRIDPNPDRLLHVVP